MPRTNKLASAVLSLAVLGALAPLSLAQPAAKAPTKAPAKTAKEPEKKAEKKAEKKVISPENRAKALKVVDRFVKAIGGAERLSEKRSSHMVGTVSLMGQTGTLEVYSIPGESFLQKMSMPALGLENMSGSDGKHGWTYDSMSGAQLMPDAMHEQLKREADPASILRYDEMYPVIEYLGDGDFNGQKVESIRVVDQDGLESIQHYAKDTGLLIGGEGDQDSPQGKMRVQSQMEDYKDFDGIKIATKSTMLMGPMTMEMTVQSVETGKVKPEDVAPPAAVQKLLEKVAAKGDAEGDKDADEANEGDDDDDSGKSGDDGDDD